jgi:hypothetical protein
MVGHWENPEQKYQSREVASTSIDKTLIRGSGRPKLPGRLRLGDLGAISSAEGAILGAVVPGSP